MSDHFIEQCKHGQVVRQCRCIGKKEVRIVACMHPDAPGYDLPDVDGDWSLKAIFDRDELIMLEHFPDGRPKATGAAYDRHLLVNYIKSLHQKGRR